MKKPVLEVIRFDEADIITSSGLGMEVAGLSNGTEGDATFKFFGNSSYGDVEHNAHKEDIVPAFNSYFKWRWENLDGISLNKLGQSNELESNELGQMIYNDGFYGDSDPAWVNYNGTYYFRNGGFYSN